ncbi:beta-N-acetylhexosaminidase [Pedobacter punctiformis]|uniref:beta-N-acetylhexosaminidase n=1 Tax=Pedobacter punctiformis TaxID=3004097 RepID=A0ABT4L9Z2_9SPHI|nr:beta-N-acetylhexosaminidase [Pedobacter sp. HCMS5-2]MCZ4244752.1 beta-N-acetylhexosaminidase [Pedobacter sp. HCMS5-2]
MRVFTFLFLLAITFNLSAQEINIIPQPVKVEIKSKNSPFIIDSNTQIIAADSLSNNALFLKDYLFKYLGSNVTQSAVSDRKTSVIKLVISNVKTENEDRYELNSDAKQITIQATSSKGIFYGIQTLIQLLPYSNKAFPVQVPSVSIIDYPRFAYRGMHLDVSRHFFDIAFVKQYIDYLALHKMNYFHWHLTDDHGWRIEIKKYPKLTEVGAWRNGSIIGLYPGTGNDGIKHGGFYTQEQIKEVIKYAADRYVTIIPEIEMPAHNMAVLASYPELGTEPSKKYEVAQTWGIFNKFNNVLQPTEKTFSFLEDVLTEVMDLFPAPYIHVGGDEAAKTWWKQSAVAQQIMKANNLKDESALQSYFIRRMEKFVNSKGKTIIGWNEILQGGLAPNAIVMSWQGEKGGIEAAKQGHKAIMTPENKMYFNHAQFVKEDSLTANKLSPLIDVYNYEPIPAELTAEQAKYIWGGQGCLWSEYITNPAKVQYMLFPRLDALSEILWSPKGKRNYPDFKKRLNTQFKRYDLMGITYSKRYLTGDF